MEASTGNHLTPATFSPGALTATSRKIRGDAKLERLM